MQKNEPKLKLLITQSYKTLIENLIEISKRPFQVCPWLEKSSQKFQIKLINSGVESGQIQFHIDEVVYNKPKKFSFEVVFSGKKMDYKQQLDSVQTGKNQGQINVQLLSTRFTQSNTSEIEMEFFLIKKNMLSTDSLKAKQRLDFSVFENDPVVFLELGFESHSGK